MRNIRRNIRHLAANVVRTVYPKLYFKGKLERLSRAFHEPELHYLPYLCDKKKISIDIGASEGIFSSHLIKYSSRCIAFEPRPKQAAQLQQIFSLSAVSASVEPVALSDRAGETVLRVLTKDPGRSTIDDANPLEDKDGSSQEEIRVPVSTLDQYQLADVGFIKIDVEGHEISVLRGGNQTIAKSRPYLLIEIEDRHHENAIREVSEFLRALDYSGFFMKENQLNTLEQFSRDIDQNPDNIGGWVDGWKRKGIYINNFFFVPNEKVGTFVENVKRMTP